ncbi:MAG: protein kinase [Gemmatimonadota bacterium]
MTADDTTGDVRGEREVLQLIDEALLLPTAERDAFLHARCGADAHYLGRARVLLAACQQAGGDEGFLAQRAADLAEPLVRAGAAREARESIGAIPLVARALAGRYELLLEIGRGGNAVVHLARDTRHGRDVAVKILHANVAETGQRARFFREVDIVARLRHPYVVPLIDSGEAEGILYYVMSYVEGESLRHRMDADGALALDVALSLARDVAEALDAAQALGIVHRDIKPQNILLSGPHALVADFGIALAVQGAADERLTERGMVVGTPAYMSPEQSTASDRIDARSDEYSLACVVYEMLTGELPYPGVTAQGMRAKHLHAPIPDLTILRPALPAAMQEVMARAMAKAAADRFPTSGEFMRALTSAATDAEPAVARGRRGSPPAVPVTRRRLILSVGALGVVLATAFGGWRWSRRTNDGPGGEGTAPASAASVAAAAPAAAADQRRIAVLYFDNLSDDPRVGRIAHGLTEDLIDELGAVRGLHVISPNGVRPFRDVTVPIDSIGRALAVGTVVGGSVSASPTVLRATVRLVDPASGEQLQSRALEVPRGEALALRLAIVAEVATFLRKRLGEEIRLRAQRSQTRSTPAWELVRRADELSRDGAAASNASRDDDARDLLRRADSLYASAGRLDPTWIAPIVGRGWVALRLALASPPAEEQRSDAPATLPSDGMHDAIAYADRALRRSAGAPEALALRGFAREWLATSGATRPESLLVQGERDLRAALAERPDDARSWSALGELLSFDGRFAEAATALDRAYNADAFLTELPAVVNERFFVALSLEQFADADRWCALGLARYPGDPRFASCRLILLGWTGRTTRELSSAWHAIDDIERPDSAGTFVVQWGFFRLMAAAVAARAGRRDSALAIVRYVRSQSAGRVDRPPFREAEAYVRLLVGERATASRLLAEALRESPSSRNRVLRSPWFRTIAADSALVFRSQAADQERDVRKR